MSPSPPRRFADAVLRYPRIYAIVASIAVALSLPSLFADFYCDDQLFVLRLEGALKAPIPGPWNLYTFASGVAVQRELPWWTIEGFQIAFLRPLSSALFTLDHAVAGHHPLPYHLHSIAWYVVAVVTAAALLRRVLPEREAALAALVFAAAPAHWMVASWPSARHVAVAGVFALASIALHVRARERGTRGPSWMALAGAAIALTGGETALGVFGYVLAYELLGRTDTSAQKARALAPWGVLFAAYAVVYRTFGFGVRGSSGYIDPIATPGAYLASLPTRVAVIADAALLGPPSELSSASPEVTPVLAALGVFAVVVVVLLLRRALQSQDVSYRRTLRWIIVGAFIALLPGVASIGDRVLFLPDIGIAAALATVFLHAGKRGASSMLGVLPARVGVALFALVHGLLGPLSFAFGASFLARTSHAALAAVADARIAPRADLHVYGIGLSDPLIGMYLGPALLLTHPDVHPRALDLLSISPLEHRIERTGDRTLEIAVLRGALLDSGFESLVRPKGAPLRAGDIVPYGEFTVRVLEDRSGHPTRFEVQFDRSLDDPSVALVAWRDGALRTISPLIGETIAIPHAGGPGGF